MPSRIVGLVVALANALRSAGVAVSTGETLDAVAALTAVGPEDRRVIRSALRATLVKDPAHETVFVRLFDLLFPLWSAEDNTRRAGSTTPPGPGTTSPTRTAATRTTEDLDELRTALAEALRRGDGEEVTLLLDSAVRSWAGIDGPPGTERRHLQRVLRRLDLGTVLQHLVNRDPGLSTLERRVDLAAAAAQIEEVRKLLESLVAARMAAERLTGGNETGRSIPPPPPPGGVDLADRQILLAGPDEIAALRIAIRPLARRLATRLGRKRRRGRGRLDMRRTLRRSMSAGGVPLDPQLRRRSPSKPDLAVLCDVSGSVAQFAPFALALLHALHAEFRRVRSWVFVDGIVEITDVLDTAPGVLDAHRLLDRRGLVAGDGRSDYGRAFATFLSTWGEAVTGKTTVLVVGDARSHDRSPAVTEVARLHRLARRLYWLNPEPRREWDTGDSVMAGYAVHCTQAFEVSTLRQLSACVAAIA